MNRKRFFITAGIGCGILLIILIVAVPVTLFFFFPINRSTSQGADPNLSGIRPGAEANQSVIPTLSPSSSTRRPFDPSNLQQGSSTISSELLSSLYEQANPGVVSLIVSVDRGGQMGQVSGSGFILDDQGHIVTNNHVVSGAQWIIINFFDGTQRRAEIVGTDVDSDLAVVRVDQLVEGSHPLPLGDSDQVIPGEWVLAIGNPFSLNSTMTIGVVSAVGRAIPSGVTPFRIPQSIQTDAAINPGNSGGPLLDLRGEVIGVNAQIATGGQSRANAGVGFAIPVNIVRRVVPVLIQEGSFHWPYLGVRGNEVNLFLQEANNLDTQRGAYIHAVVDGGPADQAGLQGTRNTVEIDGIETLVGGDVVIEANGKPLADFFDLLAEVAFSNPGDQMDLTIIRDGQRRSLTVELGVRPEDFEQDQFQLP